MRTLRRLLVFMLGIAALPLRGRWFGDFASQRRSSRNILPKALPGLLLSALLAIASQANAQDYWNPSHYPARVTKIVWSTVALEAFRSVVHTSSPNWELEVRFAGDAAEAKMNRDACGGIAITGLRCLASWSSSSQTYDEEPCVLEINPTLGGYCRLNDQCQYRLLIGGSYTVNCPANLVLQR